MRGRSDQFELGDGRLANALDFAQARFGSVDGFRERAEGLDQGLGERLDVAARDDAEQQLPAAAVDLRLRRGDLIRVLTPSGGGFGK